MLSLSGRTKQQAKKKQLLVFPIQDASFNTVILITLLLLVNPNLGLETTNETTTNLNNSNSSNATSEDERLTLVHNDFVDYTESPLLLFEPTTTKSEQELNQTTTKSREKDQIARGQGPKINVTSGADINSESEEEEKDKDKESLESERPDSSPNESNSEPDSESESESESGSDSESDSDSEAPFEAPKNVSAYMDYIERLFHDLRHQITYLFEPHIPQLIRTSQMVVLSAPCSHDILRLALALRQFEPWALKMIDSSGKVPEGIFEGSFTALGSFDQCLNVVFASGGIQTPSSSGNSQPPNQAALSGNQSRQTQGKYCLVNVSPFLPPKPTPFERVDRLFQEEANRRNYSKDDQLSRLSPMFYYMRFRIGVCVPSTCDDSDMSSISRALSSSLKLNITIDTCRSKETKAVSTHQLVGGTLAALMVGLVLSATLLDYWRRSGRRLRRKENQIVLMSVQGGRPGANKLVEAAACCEPPPHRISRGLDGITGKRLTLTDYSQCTSGLRSRRCIGTHKAADNGNSKNKQCNHKTPNCTHSGWRSFSLITNFGLHFQSGLDYPSGPLRKRLKSSISNSTSSISNPELVSDPLKARPQEPPIESHMNAHLQTQFITNIPCLNGIRVLSLCWVIVANSYITLDPRATKGLSRTRELPRDFLFQLIVQASLAIETFFFLSGLLMSLSFSRRRLAELAHSGKNWALAWCRFYLHRYIRLTAPAMLVIAFTMFAFRYGDGPLWMEVTHRAHVSCSQNWWRHLLHVANFIETRQMCFIHYWYIAADMQLFLVGPVLLLVLARYTRIGLLVCSLLGLASMCWLFLTTHLRNLPPTLLFYSSDPESRREFGNTIMTKPGTHLLPYLVGMLLGQWLAREPPTTTTQQEGAQLGGWTSFGRTLNSKSAMKLFGLMATITVIGEIFLPYLWNNSQLPSPLLASFYAALFRFGWALALAQLVLSCRHRLSSRCNITSSHNPSSWSSSTGSECESQSQSECEDNNNDGTEQTSWCLCASGGSALNRFLSLTIFGHLSKLSFIAYLIHLPLMSVFVAQTRGLFAFSHMLVIHLALSYLLMTFMLSFVLVHIIEFPFISLERNFFHLTRVGRARRRKKDGGKENESKPNQLREASSSQSSRIQSVVVMKPPAS